MPPSSGELWGYNFMPANVEVYCLLPTGIIVPLEVCRDKSLSSLKGESVHFYLIHKFDINFVRLIFINCIFG